ncbi:hypothetical protein [Chondrinema litorale]|uniref:hypothetical protein n=1 Tax=Chondrinema litorale TaxID=2994555 RepID=UPI002542A4E1|nr:hypothetical protein [Chondrinema litorale]UZS00120.1 hypothetical protein OQ292_39880 [Chondrinema litorale]
MSKNNLLIYISTSSFDKKGALYLSDETYLIMLQIDISKTDASIANMQRKSHKSPIVRNRIHTIWLLYQGYKRGDCARILGLRASLQPHTITSYIRLYNQGGLDALCTLNYKKPVSAMEAYSDKIKDAIDSLLPDSISAIRQWISDNLGIERSLHRVRVFIKKLGIKRRKARLFPGSKNIDELIDKQEAFKDDILFPLLKNSLSEEINMIFMDAAHFVMGSYNRYIWSKEPRYKSTSHGRYRINAIGGLDIKNRQILTLYNDTTVKAQIIAEYLKWLRNNHYLELNKRLYIILDNARHGTPDISTVIG